MASVHIKYAYYSVSSHEDYHKYLAFRWNDHVYTFVVFPNGLAPSPFA